MFVSLTDVKINNNYDYVKSVAPTVTDDSNSGYAVGETWLNTVTGYSYIATDVTVGAAVWERTETDKDAIIERDGDNTFKKVLKNLNNTFVVDRNEPYEDLDLSRAFPSQSNFIRNNAVELFYNESVFSKWTYDSVTKTITAGDDVYGTLDEFAAGDYILISGSRRNDNYFTIDTVTSTVITVLETIADGEAYSMISLSVFPPDFILLMGRLIWWDVYGDQTTGLKSEKIGTYSYTLQELSDNGYPADVIKGMQAYEKTLVGGISSFVN